MRTTLALFVILGLAINFIDAHPTHVKDVLHKKEKVIGAKELIKLKIADAAKKSGAAIKAKGAAALAVAKVPVLMTKKAVASVIGTKALIVSKVSAAAAVAKGATAAKAALIAKKAFGVKFDAKKELKGSKHHDLKNKLVLPPQLVDAGHKILQTGLNAVQKPIEAIRNQVTAAVVTHQKPIVTKVDAPTVIVKKPIVVAGY